jgi:hypothetical protein
VMRWLRHLTQGRPQCGVGVKPIRSSIGHLASRIVEPAKWFSIITTIEPVSAILFTQGTNCLGGGCLIKPDSDASAIFR